MPTREVQSRKVAAVHAAEAAGEVADSIPVRQELLAAVDRGEMTLAEAQSKLRAIKRSATKLGKTTRGRAWRAG